MREILLAGLIGIIEGLTEFIPVSSTGHIILLSKFLDFKGGNNSFEIFIQLGAILAVLVFYKKDIQTILFDKAEIIKYTLAIIPVVILGLAFHSQIKAIFFNPKSVAFFLIIGAVLLFFAQKIKTRSDSITYKNAFTIGLFQCLSLLPGFSRSGSCISGGLLSGINKTKIADFSFILAVPVISMAAFYDLYKNFNHLSIADLPVFASGFITSFIFGFLSIKFFISYLKKSSLTIFVIYRIVLGAIILATS